MCSLDNVQEKAATTASNRTEKQNRTKEGKVDKGRDENAVAIPSIRQLQESVLSAATGNPVPSASEEQPRTEKIERSKRVPPQISGARMRTPFGIARLDLKRASPAQMRGPSSKYPSMKPSRMERPTSKMPRTFLVFPATREEDPNSGVPFELTSWTESYKRNLDRKLASPKDAQYFSSRPR